MSHWKESDHAEKRGVLRKREIMKFKEMWVLVFNRIMFQVKKISKVRVKKAETEYK